jgi:uncharacterized phage protein gp47/JayE
MTNIPTIAQLYANIISDIEGEMGVQISPVGRSFLRALAAVQAAKLKLIYLLLGKVQKNIFVDTADPASRGGTLERFGFVKLNRNPFPPIAGEYDVAVTGSAGAVIPAQSTFKSNDDALNAGYLFTLDNAYTLTGSNDTITLRALTAGLESELAVADRVTATAPIALVDSLAVVTGITVNPQAAESIETYRQRAIDAYRLEPQGGAATDYRLWAGDAQGVERVYPYAASGATNEVNVFVEATAADSVPTGSGIPTAQILSDVEDVIDFDPDTSRPLNERGRRPVQVIVNVLPIVPQDVDVTITGYVNLTPTIEATITAALTDAINAIRPFVSGADVVADRNDTLNVFNLIAVVQQAVPSGFFTSLTFEVDGTPYNAYQFTDGNIPNVNSINIS